MKIMLKRLFNVFTLLVTIGLIFSLSSHDPEARSQKLADCGFLYAMILAFNYIFLGAVTLWHKKE
jgi:hypothetical protein